MSGISGVGAPVHIPTERAAAALNLSIMSPEMQAALLTALRGVSNAQGAAMHAMARMVDVRG